MNISKQLEKFYLTLDINTISTNAIALYTILVQLAKLANNFNEFKVTNTILKSKTRLNTSALQRARNELITNNFITYKKGTNQIDASKYGIIDLTDNSEQTQENIENQNTEQTTENLNIVEVEQPNAQPNEQPNAQANTTPIYINNIIITTLNLLFNYINKGDAQKFSKEDLQEIGVTQKEKKRNN